MGATSQRVGVAQEERRRELQDLFDRLNREVTQLSESYSEQAQSIRGFAQVAAHEASRKEQNKRLLKLGLEGLRTSVEEFEACHPKLVQIAGAISNMLASMGI